MKRVFLIFGYGVPKNIMSDAIYRHYLETAKTYIHNAQMKDPRIEPIVILSGGRTDCYKPYKRTEAGEMKKYIKRNNAFVVKPKKWLCIAEKKSLSTLENFLNCMSIIKSKRLSKSRVVIFCESSRKLRITKLANFLIKKPKHTDIVAVNFHTALHFAKPPSFIKKKEAFELQHSLDALKSKKNLRMHHALFKKKFAFLRKAGPKNANQAMEAWWEKSKQFTFS